MNRLAVLIPLAACGSGSAPQTARVESRVAPIAAPVARTGRHAASIDLVTASEDGTAALTQDVRGGTRLWPSLDGRREPVIVPMLRAAELHLGRTATGFVLAGLDEAGGVEVVAVADNGRVQARTRLAPEPAFEVVRIRGSELIALRADQTIAIIEPSGEIRASVPAPVGERVVDIATRGDRALALFESGRGAIRGAWLAESAWGAPFAAAAFVVPADRPLATLQVAGARISPSGTRLAVPFDRGIAVTDLKTGVVDVLDIIADRVELTDDITVVAFQSTSVRVRDVRAPADGDVTQVGTSPVAIGTRVLSGVGDQLELCTPAYTRVTPHSVGPRVDVDLVPAAKTYLGYRLGALVGARVTPSGMIVSGGSQDLVELEPDLHTSRRTELPADSRILKDAIRLDERYVLASHAYSETSFAVSVLDTTTGLTLEILSTPVQTPMLRYERSTELLAVGDASTAFLLRRNPATSKFDTWFRIGSGAADLRVLDPAATNGVVAMVLREDTEPRRTRVERIRANQLVVGSAITGLETFYAGAPLGIDARGRIYVADGDALVAWDDDRELARIPGVFAAKGAQGSESAEAALEDHGMRLVGAPATTPHVVAAGDHIALVRGERVSLFDDDGTPRWDIDAPGLRDVGWMNNALVASFDSGLAKLELDTGHLAGATCGWAFGLSETQNRAVAGEGESICEAP